MFNKYMTINLYIDTLTEVEIAKIEARLRPNQSSKIGFLGPSESLKEVIYQDAETLRRLGLTHEEIADKLEYLVSNPQKSHGFKVDSRRYRGSQQDPFQEGRSSVPHSNKDITITNSIGEVVTFPGLIIKLIRDYQFFEGRGTSYRLDPENAVKILHIQPGEKYELNKPRQVFPLKKSGKVYRGR